MQALKLRFPEFPVLKTERLALREITPEDRQEIFNIFSDPAVTRYYDVETMQGMQEAEALIKYWQKRIRTGKALRWGITQAGSPRLIGTGGFSELYPENFCGEIGCDLAQPFWGRGIMTEVMTEVVRFGFEVMGLNRIETWIMVENKASIKMVGKIGMKNEGLLRQRRFWMEKFNDVEMFGLLRQEWEKLHKEQKNAG